LEKGLFSIGADLPPDLVRFTRERDLAQPTERLLGSSTPVDRRGPPRAPEAGGLLRCSTPRDWDIQKLLTEVNLMRFDLHDDREEIDELKRDIDRLNKTINESYLPYIQEASPQCLGERVDGLRRQLDGICRMMDKKFPQAGSSMQKTCKGYEKLFVDQAEQAARAMDIEEKHEEWLGGLRDSVTLSPGLLYQMKNMTIRESRWCLPATSSYGGGSEGDTLLVDDTQMKDGSPGDAQGASGQDGEEDMKNDKKHKRNKARKPGKKKAGRGKRR